MMGWEVREQCLLINVGITYNSMRWAYNYILGGLFEPHAHPIFCLSDHPHCSDRCSVSYFDKECARLEWEFADVGNYGGQRTERSEEIHDVVQIPSTRINHICTRLHYWGDLCLDSYPPLLLHSPRCWPSLLLLHHIYLDLHFCSDFTRQVCLHSSLPPLNIFLF